MDEELTNEQRAALRALEREVPPPPELENRIARALAKEGLLRRPRRAALAAAAAVLFAAGLVVGLVIRPLGAGGGPSGTRYLLLLESPADERPAEEEARVTAIVDWARRQRAAGIKLSGEKLADGGYALTSAGSQGLPVAPYVLGGYFVVGARDDDEARRIAASHPLVGWGGRIILRRIEEL